MADGLVAPALRLASGASLEESGEAVRIVRADRAFRIAPADLAVRTFLRRLAAGELGADLVATAECWYVVAALEERGLLAAAIPGLIDVEPLGPMRVTRSAAPERPLLSRFAVLRRAGGSLAVESGLASGRALIHGRAGAALAAALAAAEAAELEPRQRAAVALLRAARLLAEPSEDDDPSLLAWEWHDLLFHRETHGWSDGRPRGRTYRLRGAAPPEPDARPPHTGATIALARPDLAELAASDPPFTAVLERRRSVRRFDDAKPITRTDLGHLLFRAAARRQHLGGEIERSRRPAPRGGALAALELYLAVRTCEGLDPGLYHYEPDTHVLRALGRVTGAIVPAVDGGDPPQVALLIALRHARIAWVYERIAYQLALLDLGVLYQTLLLTATALGLGGYPLGSIDAESFARATGLDPLQEAGIGAFLLGRPGDASRAT